VARPGCYLVTSMSNRSHASTSRSEFPFQTSDQAGGASQQQTYGHYDAERDTAASGAIDMSHQASDQDSSLRYHDFGVPQIPGQFQGYEFSPSAPLNWDWTNSIDFTNFTNQYEPQGELVQELENQALTTNEFNVSMPVTSTEPAFQIPQQTQSAPPIAASSQNPLSPPLRPPQRPVVQTGLK